VNFFVWTAARGKILSLDDLRKRGIIVINWCCMCNEKRELIDHLFLHSTIARMSSVWLVSLGYASNSD
jgi:hypothetical protein